MRNLLFAFVVVLVSSSVSAREYGNYDLKRLVTVSETPPGKKYGFDGAYCDQILNDLSAHAKNYPPQFDTIALLHQLGTTQPCATAGIQFIEPPDT